MATRVDFYVLHPDNRMEFLGNTCNEYYGDFETATNENDYRKSVSELMEINESVPGKWYWPWKNSHISDEVFVFKLTPKWYSSKKGFLITKVCVKGCDEDSLYFAKYTERYDERFCDEGGYYNPVNATKIKLPQMAKFDKP